MNGDKVKCGKCEMELSYADKSTSSMRKHLDRIHDIKLTVDARKKHNLDSDADLNKKKGDARQPTLTGFLGSKSTLSTDSDKYKKITFYICKMIFVDLQPLSFINDVGFINLMKETERRYVIPSRKSFRNRIIPGLFHQSVKGLKDKIKRYKERYGANNSMFSITTDGWTSSANHSFIAYSLHIIRDDLLAIDSFCLGVHELSRKHTADNLRAHLLSILQDWDILPRTARPRPTPSNSIDIDGSEGAEVVEIECEEDEVTETNSGEA